MHPLIVGHRGNARHAPENTCISFAQAIQAGATMVEMDTRLSKDGQIVLMHDETIDRTTNASGRVIDLTAAELSRLDAGSWKHPKYRGEPVPTLAQVAQLCRGKAVMMLDLKCRGQGPALARWVEDHAWPADQMILAPWDIDEGIALRRELPHVRKILICESPPPPLEQLKNFGFDGISIDVRILNEPIARSAHALGLTVYTWTVNDWADLKRGRDMGVDGIITDDPAQAMQVFGA